MEGGWFPVQIAQCVEAHRALAATDQIATCMHGGEQASHINTHFGLDAYLRQRVPGQDRAGHGDINNWLEVGYDDGRWKGVRNELPDVG